MARRNFVQIETDVDIDLILDDITIEEILERIDQDKFLDEIGIEYCKEYFNLRD